MFSADSISNILEISLFALPFSLSLNAVRMSEQLNPAGFLAFRNSLNHVRTAQNNDFSGNWILSHPNIFVANRRQGSWREECQLCNGNRSLSWRNQAFSIVLSWRQSFKAQLWDWHAHRSLNNTAWDLPKRESPTSHSSAVRSSEPRIISLHSPTVNLFSGMKRIKMDLCFCRKKQAYFCNKPRSVLVMNPLDACPQTLRCLIGREVCTGVFCVESKQP